MRASLNDVPMAGYAWVRDGKTKIDIVVYKVWKEVARYSVIPQ